MSKLPEPMTPPNCDLRGYDYMPLVGQRLFQSRLYAKSLRNPRAGLAAIKLWWAAWLETPAGSLPDDDDELAMLADFGTDNKGWMAVRELALYGFVKCSDGRLYHPVLCEQAVKSFDYRLKADAKRETDRERLRKWREDRKKRDSTSTGNTGGNGSDTRTSNDVETQSQQAVGTCVEARVETQDETPIETRFVAGRCDEKLQENGELTLPRENLTAQDVESAVSEWNAMAGRTGLSKITKVTDKRKRDIKARLRDCGGLDGWRDALRVVSESPFLKGDVTTFKADIDFVIKPDRFVQIMEGRYTNRGKGRPSTQSNLDWQHNEMFGTVPPTEWHQ